MTIAVRYFTRSGNTKKLAVSIADAVGAVAYDTSVPLTEKADLLFLGSSVYGGDADDAVKAFIKDNADRIGTIVNFSTAALVRSTYKQVKKLAQQNGVAMAAEEFYCKGSFTILHKDRPNEADLQNAADFARAMVKKQ